MKEINVLVTGAAGQIGYALLTRLASGETFGSDVKVNLNLVEVPQVVSRLEGSRMELEDCGFNTLGTVKSFSDMNEASGDIDWALLVGSIPRGITINGKKIEERADLLKINGGIFTEQGKALGENAKADAKILVVGNPANTNALIVKDAANNVIVPAGKVVPSNFQVSYYNGSTTVTANPVVSVTNAMYETELNSKKQNIQVIKPKLIEDFVAEYKALIYKGKITAVASGTSDINM